eukprot:COSAG01_NODE_6955_length_3419_cov_95.063855_3_plen_174_part_00
MASYGPDPQATFMSVDTPNAVLPTPACQVLARHLDRCAFASNNQAVAEIEEDFKLVISTTELEDLIGRQCFDRLKAAPGFPTDFTTIKLRRCQSHNKSIDFHTDFSQRTMQVPLNGDDEYTGGKLVFLTRNGVHVPSRPIGSMTVHDNTILHGVSKLVRGVRYGLFFLVEDGL